MSTYNRAEEEICENYLQYDVENKYYKIKKSGWYVIEIESSCAQNNNYSYTITNVLLNDKNINTCKACGMYNSVDFNSNSLTLYLSKDNTISVTFGFWNEKNKGKLVMSTSYQIKYDKNRKKYLQKILAMIKLKKYKIIYKKKCKITKDRKEEKI